MWWCRSRSGVVPFRAPAGLGGERLHERALEVVDRHAGIAGATVSRRRGRDEVAPAGQPALEGRRAGLPEVERAARLAGVGPNPEALPPLQWIERYLAAKNKAPERISQLVKAAESLLNED